MVNKVCGEVVMVRTRPHVEDEVEDVPEEVGNQEEDEIHLNSIRLQQFCQVVSRVTHPGNDDSERCLDDTVGGRKSFELMGGTQDQEAFGMLKSFIWRTVSFQAIPKKVLCLRNFLIPLALLLIAVDCVDSWHISYQTTLYKRCAAARSNAFNFALTSNCPMTQMKIVGKPKPKPQPAELMMFDCTKNQTALNMTTGEPVGMYSVMAYQLEETGYIYNTCPDTDQMMNVGMLRDWLAACYAGSISLFFGVLWLYKEMILFAFIMQMVILPSWTVATLYVYYHQPNGSVLVTWWYAGLCVAQFFIGWAAMYLYAYLKYDLETRAREEEIKQVMGKMTFPRQTDSIRAYPCGCKLWDKDKDNVIKRYDNMHQIDIRANIMCPLCKNRIDFIQQ